MTGPRPPLLIGLMGPTGSGKSDLAEALADRYGAQLINADAFQVYRGLDIGTAKPTDRDKYRLLDIKDPCDSFGAGEFVQIASAVLGDLYLQARSAIVVGGTGLYIRALFEEYQTMGEAPRPELRLALNELSLDDLVTRLSELDATTAQRIDLKNRARVQRAVERAMSPSPSIETLLPPFRKVKVGLVPATAKNDELIERRVHKMIQNGWVEEVRDLRKKGVSRDCPGLRAIGYRTLWKFIEGTIEREEAVATTIAETRRYAKRQRTWLRSEPNLNLLDWDSPLVNAVDLIDM